MQFNQSAPETYNVLTDPAENLRDKKNLVWIFISILIMFIGGWQLLSARGDGILTIILGFVGLFISLNLQFVVTFLLETLFRSDSEDSHTERRIILEDIIYPIFTTVLIILTGGFSSIFFPLIFVVTLFFNFNSKFVDSLKITIAMIMIILIYSVMAGNLSRSALMQFPFFIITPLLFAYFLNIIRQESRASLFLTYQATNRLEGLTVENTLLKSIVQSFKQGLVIVDRKNRITLVNKATLDLLSPGNSNIIGHDLSAVLPNIDLSSQYVTDYHVDVVSTYGVQLFLSLNTFPLLNNAELQGQVIVIQDISKESEFEKLKLDFVAQAVHQLRTPLTIIKSYLSVFSEMVNKKLSLEEKLYLDRSLVGANQLASLIENLLNVSRIEKRSLIPQLAPTSFIDILTASVNRNYQMIQQKKIKISVQNITVQLPKVLIDPKLISDVLNNLIANAVEVSPVSGEIVLDYGIKDNQLFFSITDQGRGISSESTQKLFNKFYKIENNLTQNSKGIGLGLYNSKGIVEAHGGKIWVNSLVDRGSTFGFTLPVKATS